MKLIDDYTDVGVHWVVFSASPRRKKEALESADRFLDKADRKKVDVLNFQDGYFPFEGSAIKERVQELSRRDSPDLVFTHHRNDRHQDHRLVSELTWYVLVNAAAARDRMPTPVRGSVPRPESLVSVEMEETFGNE